MKIRETLKNYGGFEVDVTTDEAIGGILVAIKYNDHGDEFLYVKTYSGEEYEYGYYLNRRDCWERFDLTRNNGESDGFFERRPIMYSDMTDTKVSEASNNVFFKVHDDVYGFTKWMTTSRVENRGSRAEYVLERFINCVEKHTSSGIYCNFEQYKELAFKFVEINELGQEYIDRLNALKWSTLKDGLAGVAGKIKRTGIIYCDKVISVLYRGKNYDLHKVNRRRGRVDEWGYATYAISTRQFQ